ncbi:MAG: type II toxin-antitoxin system VapC family toxin [Nitrospirae bacterium]|nr:type II toxin-antitoxin system VapC family toxin [Nitrospirota bacterium]
MLSESVFVDTGAWFALADRDDAHHPKAVALFPSLLRTYRRLATSNLVVAESYVLILRSLGHAAAVQFLEKINSSPRIMRILSTADIERAAEEMLRKYEDQDFSYADSVSFAIMRYHKIEKVFSFDRHFQVMGFTRVL